jgi:hypothetical protein
MDSNFIQKRGENMDEGLERKYKGEYGKRSKEMPVKEQKLEKDLTEQSMKPKLKTTPKLHNDKFYNWEITYIVNRSVTAEAIYKTLTLLARSKAEAAEDFRKWADLEAKIIKAQWKIDHPNDKAHFGYWKHPDYFKTITNIEKKFRR